jgi:hypothetical protein
MERVFMSIAVIVALLMPVEWAAAGADHRTSLDRKERAVRAWQKDLNQRFKDADREADRFLGRTNKSFDSGKATNRTGAGNK